jgi:hypothetical protein
VGIDATERHHLAVVAIDERRPGKRAGAAIVTRSAGNERADVDCGVRRLLSEAAPPMEPAHPTVTWAACA